MCSLVLLSAMLAALTMAPVSPEAGNILFLVAGAASLALLRKADFGVLVRPIVWMPLAGLTILGAAFVMGSGTAEGLTGLLPFAPILAAVSLATISYRGQAPTPQLLAVLALVGVCGTVAIALNDYLLAGIARAGASVANPIHFADVALLAGFLALIGVVKVQNATRYLFLLGPVIAAVSVILSGTRGAIVALVIMAAVAVVTAVSLRLIRLKTFAVASASAALIFAAGFALGLGETPGGQRLMRDIADVLETGLPADGSTAIRLSMYQGGLEAFWASPWFGHGPFAFVDAAAATQETPLFVGAPHLHNDIFDFAASGGIFGLLSFGLLLLAPVVTALQAPESSSRKGLIVVTSALTAGFFVMGLTNAMFGILTLTVYFAAICVVVGTLSQSRDPEIQTQI